MQLCIMNILFTLYPMSIIVLGMVCYIIGYCLIHNIIFVLICLLSVLRLVSIKPILQAIDDWIYSTWKEPIDNIRQNIRESFIVQGNLTNSSQAIYILHPHGIFSLTHIFHAATDITDWPYRNMKGVAHVLLTKIPFLADLLDEDKYVESTYQQMKGALKEGHSISLCLGNISEAKYLDDYKITAIVKKRTGIFKMSIETGIPIIPVLSYGEQSMFKQMYTFGILERLSKLIGMQLPFPNIESMVEWLSIYRKPLDKKIYTHIGQPIAVGEPHTPTKDEINALRDKYIDALTELYKETRPANYEEMITII